MKRIFLLVSMLLILVPTLSPAYAQQGTSNATNSTSVQHIFSYSLSSSYVVNQFGWTSSLISLQIHNTGLAASPPEPISVAFPLFYYKTLWSYNVSGISAVPVLSQNSTYFNSTLPSIPAAGNLNVSIEMEFYGLVRATGAESYLLPITPVPIVTLPDSKVTNATVYFTIPNSVLLINQLTLERQNFTQVGGNPYAYRFSYTNVSDVYPFPVNIQFNATSTAAFAIFRISNLDRIIKYGLDGSIVVTDELTVVNNDSIELTSINLTKPVSGTYQIAEGQIHASPESLSTGIVNLPAPIPYQGVSVIDISYTLNRGAIAQNGGGLEVNLSKYGLVYPALVGDYEVTTELPSGSSVKFLGPSSFTNVTTTPPVTLVVDVPPDYILRPAFPVAVAALAVALVVYAVYARSERSGAEGEVDAIIEQKKKIILGLIEDVRLRGEGFAPYAYFTDERREFEAVRNRLNAQINELRAKAKKDKSYRSPVDRLSAVDARMEQAYKEAKQALEDKLSGKLTEKEFAKRIESLRDGLSG